MNDVLDFKPLAKVTVSVSLERAEEKNEDDSISDIHRVIVTGPDGEPVICSGPNADEAITSSVQAVIDTIRGGLKLNN